MCVMDENALSKIIVDTAFRIHKEMGPGLYESVYEAILSYELADYGLKVQRQVAIPVLWREVNLDVGFRADIIVEDKVVIEIKSVETLSAVHAKQVLTYLRLSNLKLGLLFNFNEALLKSGIKRLVNNL